ncbi:radical SAM protein [Streptomyces sp. NPDC056144]|uniref:radical SAM protein n=1 Tax=unclassified Streptomyces TaxID=2593676 RepID=UPI0035E3B8CF
MIDDCGLACTFCHNEGTPVTADNKGRTLLPFLSGPGRSGRVSLYSETNGVDFLAAKMAPDLAFRRAVRTVARAFDCGEVHLTGGEPTLHTEVTSLVSALTGMGLTVGMTSNGERGRQVMPDCSAAGLNRVNVSVFGTNAEELQAVQPERFRSVGLADAKIRAAEQTIRAAVSHGVKVSVNVVVPGATHVDRVVNLIESYGQFADVRMLTSIQEGPESIAAMSEVLSRVGAEPVLRTFTAGTSDERTLYRALGSRAVYVKRLLPVRRRLHPAHGSVCVRGRAGEERARGRGAGLQGRRGPEAAEPVRCRSLTDGRMSGSRTGRGREVPAGCARRVGGVRLLLRDAGAGPHVADPAAVPAAVPAADPAADSAAEP